MKTISALLLALLLFVVPHQASAQIQHAGHLRYSQTAPLQLTPVQLYSRYQAQPRNNCGGNRMVGVFEFERCPSPYAPGYGPPTYPPGGVSPASPVMCGHYPCANQPAEYFADRPRDLFAGRPSRSPPSRVPTGPVRSRQEMSEMYADW